MAACGFGRLLIVFSLALDFDFGIRSLVSTSLNSSSLSSFNKVKYILQGVQEFVTRRNCVILFNF